MKYTGLILFLLLGLVGCSTTNKTFDAPIDLRTYRHIYVQSAQNDSNHIDQLFASELQRLGYDATYGVRTMIPDNAQLVVLYETQWNWDFKTYLIRLDVTVSEVRTEKRVGGGNIFHSGITNMSPEEMVAEVLKPLFAPKKAKK